MKDKKIEVKFKKEQFLGVVVSSIGCPNKYVDHISLKISSDVIRMGTKNIIISLFQPVVEYLW